MLATWYTRTAENLTYYRKPWGWKGLWMWWQQRRGHLHYQMMRINDGVSANVSIAGIGRTEGASPGKVIVYCGCRVTMCHSLCWSVDLFLAIKVLLSRSFSLNGYFSVWIMHTGLAVSKREVAKRFSPNDHLALLIINLKCCHLKGSTSFRLQ